MSHHELAISEASQTLRRSELDPTESFNQALLIRLRSLRPNFLNIRSSMGLGPEVGFGFIPSLHGAYTLGCIPSLERSSKGRRWSYPILGVLGGIDGYVPMTREDRERIIVMPDAKTAKPKIVSVYQRKGYAENGEVEERLLTVPEDVIEGVVAHELTHIVRIPPHIARALRQRGFMDYETQIDVAAAMSGYKEQILAKINYMISCLKTYQGADDTGYSFLRTPGSVIQEMESRLVEVMKTEVQKVLRKR